MANNENTTRWDFLVSYSVPVAVKPNGGVEWEEHSEYRVIDLPANIENPGEFLSQSGYDDQVDIIGFREFSNLGTQQ